MTGFEGIGDFDSSDPWQRYIAHQAAKGNYPPTTPVENEVELESSSENYEPPSAPKCPNCGRVMSNREFDEQGCCNDCYDGTISWSE